MKKYTALISILCACILCACSSSNVKVENTAVAEVVNSYDDVYYDKVYNQEAYFHKASIYLDTQNYTDSERLLQSLIKEYNGYCAYSISSGTEETYSRTLTIEAKIPSTSYLDFIEELNSIGEVKSKELYSEDIPIEYTDAIIEKQSLEAQEQHLIDMYQAAETVQDMLDIESRLSSVRAKLSISEKNTTIMLNQIQYADVSISLSEYKEVTPIKQSFLEKLWSACEESANGFVRVLNSVLYLIIICTPYIVILFIWFVIWRFMQVAKINKRRKERRKRNCRRDY